MFLPIAVGGGASSTLLSMAVEWNSESAAMDMPGAIAPAEVVAPVVDGVEHRRRADVHDYNRTTEHLESGGGIDHTVCANVTRRIVADPDARARS